jgi:hypothetical protein
MIHYHTLSRRPAAFRSMTGFSVEMFQSLFLAFTRAYDDRKHASKTTKRDGKPRQRLPGAGRPYAHDLRDRLLMTLLWLRIYPTFEVLGFLFDLHKANARDNVVEVLAVLETLADFSFERPSAERRRRGSLQAVMDAFPELVLVIDAKEQRIRRPKSPKTDDRQRPYYSGKKKCHTLKSQMGVEPDGQVGAVSASVPGGAVHDLTLLRQTGLVGELATEGEAGMMDKGYVGIRKDYPEHQLYLPFKATRGHPLTPDEKAYNGLLAKYRVVAEHTLAQRNQFQVLAQVFRHARESHGQIVRVVGMLVNRRVQVRPLASYPAPIA